MMPKPLQIVFCISCLIYVSSAVNPAPDLCIAFESSYHIERACECVIFQSSGKRNGQPPAPGTFTSPNFPQIYPTNVNCILYTFLGDLAEIVELSFFEFDLQVPTTNKCQDFLKFFLDLERPEVNEHAAWNYELCGNISMIQKKHYSSGRSLILEFHTDNYQGNHTGFRGIFRFLDKAQFEITGGNKRWGSQCAYDFYSNKNSKSGKFFSPRYPQNYPPDSNCQYVFSGDTNERVKITFDNIQLENIDGSCSDSTDFIVVRDGMDATSPVIARYCNTRNGEQVISSGAHLYVEFFVDDKKQRQGFAASFQYIREDQLLPEKPNLLPTKFPPSSGSNINNVGDDPSPAKPLAPSTTKKILTDCNYDYTSTHKKNGTFSSPRYPSPYSGDITCRYTFQGQGRERVQIIFTDLDLNYPSGDPHEPYDCDDVDSVTVSITINGEPRDIGVYCGSKRPPMLMSNDNRMEVTFVSYSASSAKGFKATYQFVTDFGIKAGTQNDDMVCGFRFKSSNTPNGTFTSPNFPGLYPRNTECHYLFYGDETNERIYITFPYFDVEGIPPACVEDSQSDYVEFSNFNIDLTDRKMNRFCGTKEQHTQKKNSVNSDGNFFRVTFKSNDVYDATGFEAFYQFRKYKGDPLTNSPRPNKSDDTHNQPLLLLVLLPSLVVAAML